jgi:hypothetical protein
MSKSEFKDALDRTSEIELTVRGRKSGQDISRPVWKFDVGGDHSAARINLSSTIIHLRGGSSRNWTTDRFV